MNTNTSSVKNFDLKQLAEFYHMSEDELLQKSLYDILNMNTNMIETNQTDNALKKANDSEFAHVVENYLMLYPLLIRYWNRDQIIKTCAKYVSIRDLTEELKIPKERITCNPINYKHPCQPCEYLRSGWESVPRYTKQGEELLYGERKQCHVYRIINRYQGCKHGEIILDLLYNTYPELKEFQFAAYGCDHNLNNYEIYPKFHIYTPFHALMNKDIDAIIERNINYCEAYNHGIYTTDALSERLESKEVNHFFDIIRNLKPIRNEEVK